MRMPDPAPIDVVRARYPLTPDEDAAALQAHADHLAALHERLRPEQIRDVEPAMIFDARSERE